MQPEEIVQISPLIRRITAGNASVFTGPGTNTYLIGKEEITVLDPGPAMDSHIDAITSAEGKIKQIVVTHTHPDHSPGVRLLQERLDVPAYGMLTETSKGQDRSFKPDKILKDGDVFEETEFTLKVVHTPGHASNHLCYILEEEEFIFTGDHIMNGSTVVIGPPDGNMKQYLDSLEKSLIKLGFKGKMFLISSDAGITTISQSKKFPIRLVESGPAGGVALASYISKT